MADGNESLVNDFAIGCQQAFTPLQSQRAGTEPSRVLMLRVTD